MDLSQNKIPYNPPVSPDSPNYNPTYKGYHDPNENPSYKFGYRTPQHSKQEVSDSNGHVEGVYSFVDDIGERHDVRYKAGSGTGFLVETAFPDSKLYNDVFHKGPPGKPGGKPRGRSSIQQKLDGSYQFIASAPDHRRTEIRDNRGNVRGSYTFIDEKGLQRTVEYIAGPNIGYKVIKKGVGISFPPGPSFAPATSFYSPFSPNFEGVDSGDFPAGGGSGSQQGSTFAGSGGAGGGSSGLPGSPFGGGGSQGSTFGVGGGGSVGSSGSPFGGGGSQGSSFGAGSGGSSGSPGSPFGGGGSQGSSFGGGGGGSSGSPGSPFGGGGSQGSSFGGGGGGGSSGSPGSPFGGGGSSGSSFGDIGSQGGSSFGGSGSQGSSFGSGGSQGGSSFGSGGTGSPGSPFGGGGSQGTYGGSSGSTYGGSTTSRPFGSSTTGGTYGGSSSERPFSRPPGPPSQGGIGSGSYGKPGGSSSYPTGLDPGDSNYSGIPGTTPSTGSSTVSGSTGFGNDFLYESSPETDIVEPFLNTPTAPKRPPTTTTEYPVSGSDYFGAGEGKPPGAGPGKEPPFQGYPGGRPQNSVSLIPGDLINNCCRPRPSSTSISLASTPRPLPNYEDFYLQSPSFNNDSPPAPPPFRPTISPDRSPPDYPNRPPYSEFSLTYDEANNGRTTFKERYHKDDDEYTNSDKTYFRVPGPVRAHVQSIDLPYGSRLPNPGEALERGISHNKQS